MSYAIVDDKGNRIVISEPTPPGKCEICGKKAELRPYGPKGENICVSCGRKDKPETEKRMRQMLFGEELDS